MISGVLTSGIGFEGFWASVMYYVVIDGCEWIFNAPRHPADLPPTNSHSLQSRSGSGDITCYGAKTEIRARREMAFYKKVES